jgi:DNA-binding MarR family transcriptional regulator
LFAAAPAANAGKRRTRRRIPARTKNVPVATPFDLTRVGLVSDRSSAVIAAWESLFRAQVTVIRELSREFPSDEITFNEYDVLFNLSRQDGHRLRIRDLSRHLLLSQPSVSRMVDRLASRALVRKESDPGDGRGTFVCLTDAGYAVFRRLAVVHAASIGRHVGANLSVDELRKLTDLTDRIREGVGQAAPVQDNG